MGAPMGISGAGGLQAHRVLKVLCSKQGGDVVSSQRTPVLHLGVQPVVCYLSFLGG